MHLAELRESGTAIEQLLGEGFAGFDAIADAGDDKARGGVQHGDVALRTFDGACEHAFEDDGILRSFTTDELFDLRG